jgi:hypothetical protein
MLGLNRIKIVLVSVAVLLGVAGVGRAQEGVPVAYVTLVDGAGAIRVESGTAFAAEPRLFSDSTSGLSTGESIRTLEGGAATVVFPDFGIVVRLEESSELLLGELPVLDKAVPVSLTLLKGQAYVARRLDDARWLMVAGKSDAGAGYTMSKGGSLTVRSGPAGVAFAAFRGEVVFFDGDVPAGTLVKENGELLDATGIALPEGHHVDSRMGEEPVGEIPGVMSAKQARGRMGDSLYALGVRATENWVERAEKGDFTPVRGVSRGAPDIFPSEGLAPELTFDQPRSAVVSPAPRVATQPLRAQGVSPVRALLETRRPTSVVVGQRLRRTRIIGSPGASPGPIRVNPSVEPLIRLPRR